jgi:hypothetical protein
MSSVTGILTKHPANIIGEIKYQRCSAALRIQFITDRIRIILLTVVDSDLDLDPYLRIDRTRSRIKPTQAFYLSMHLRENVSFLIISNTRIFLSINCKKIKTDVKNNPS